MVVPHGQPAGSAQTQEKHGEKVKVDHTLTLLIVFTVALGMVLGHFVLPEQCWLDHYYDPMPPQMEAFVADHGGSLAAREFVQRLQGEIDHYRRNKAYYGYVFFVGRKK